MLDVGVFGSGVDDHPARRAKPSRQPDAPGIEHADASHLSMTPSRTARRYRHRGIADRRVVVVVPRCMIRGVGSQGRRTARERRCATPTFRTMAGSAGRCPSWARGCGGDVTGAFHEPTRGGVLAVVMGDQRDALSRREDGW
jgi:hypothetical protein